MWIGLGIALGWVGGASARPVDGQTSIDAEVLPSCLWGLDPHLSSVSPVWPGLPAGIRLHLEGSHVLRLVGLQDGDVVMAVGGRPLGDGIMTVDEGATRCTWWIQRGSEWRVFVADRRPHREGDALEVDPDGTHHVARWAVARALSDPSRRRPPSTHPSRRATSGGLHPHLRDVLDLLGVPFGASVVRAGDRVVATAADLEAAAVALLTEDSATWWVDDGTEPREVRIMMTGDPLPIAPPERVVPRAPVSVVGQAMASGGIEVLRAQVSSVSASTEGLAHTTWLASTPDTPGGVVLTAIPPGSPFDQIGLRDGDVIHQVNGIATDRADKAAAVLQSLKVLDVWTASGRRDGDPMDWSARVVDTLSVPPLEAQRRASLSGGREALARWRVRATAALPWGLIPIVAPDGTIHRFLAGGDPPEGLSPMDEVTAVAGRPLGGIADLQDAVARCGASCALRIVRDGVHLDATISP